MPAPLKALISGSIGGSVSRFTSMSAMPRHDNARIGQDIVHEKVQPRGVEPRGCRGVEGRIVAAARGSHRSRPMNIQFSFGCLLHTRHFIHSWTIGLTWGTNRA